MINTPNPAMSFGHECFESKTCETNHLGATAASTYQLTFQDKVALFQSLFQGREDVLLIVPLHMALHDEPEKRAFYCRFLGCKFFHRNVIGGICDKGHCQCIETWLWNIFIKLAFNDMRFQYTLQPYHVFLRCSSGRFTVCDFELFVYFFFCHVLIDFDGQTCRIIIHNVFFWNTCIAR